MTLNRPRILELARKGVTAQAIAERMGTSRGRVYQVCAAEGFYFSASPSSRRSPAAVEGVRSSTRVGVPPCDSAPAARHAGAIFSEGKP